MAVYKSPNRAAGGPFYWVPFCVTNEEKALFWACIVLGEAASGAAVGFAVGVVVGVLTGAPVAATGFGAVLGAVIGTKAAVTGLAIGAAIGAAWGLWTCWNAACEECGSCFEVLCTTTIWPISKFTSMLPVVPLVFLASPADCGMVPPGCP